MEDRWVEGVDKVRLEVKNYFQALYSDALWERPTLDGINFKCLSSEDNSFLAAPFSLDEIKQAVWSCDSDKSPGPDGFNFTFLKKFWSSIKEEVSLLVGEFFLPSLLYPTA